MNDINELQRSIRFLIQDYIEKEVKESRWLLEEYKPSAISLSDRHLEIIALGVVHMSMSEHLGVGGAVQWHRDAVKQAVGRIDVRSLGFKESFSDKLEGQLALGRMVEIRGDELGFLRYIDP